MSALKTCFVLATALTGMLCGASLDQSIKQLPARHIISVKAFSAYASTEYTFTNLKPGTYAAAAFHDENSDKKINSNLLGIPKEGIGVSNNVKGRFGPPKFDDAKFTFSQPTQTITIALTYL